MSNSERSALVLIREALLLSGSNDFVYDFYYKKSLDSTVIDVSEIDSETESKLLLKNDNFLDLTLAQFCLCSSTIRKIFSKAVAENNRPLLMACLSTKNLSKTRYGKGLPFFFFSSPEDELPNWLRTASQDELFLLFSNDAISDGFLVKFLDPEKELWSCLTDENKMICLDSLSRNNRIKKRYEGSYDGFAEYQYGLVFNSLWNLTKFVPVTEQWGLSVGFLLDSAIDQRYDLDSLEVAKRWHVEVDDSSSEKKKLFLNGFELVRCALYRNVVKDLVGKDKSNSIHFQNSDIAYRACAYENLELLTPEDIRIGYEKDGLVAMYHLEKNTSIWRDAILRSTFKNACWQADKELNASHLDCVNSFNRRKEYFESTHPEWFAEKIEDDYVDEEDRALTIGFSRELIGNLKKEVIESISLVKTSYRWTFYGVVLIILLLLSK